MQMTAWVTLATFAVYIWMIYNVGRARGTYQISAPIHEGPEPFMCVLRVQANTVEQLVIQLPALWMCAFFLGDRWAAIGGVIWVVGRVIYAKGYYKHPAARSAGFGISTFATVALMIGTAVGLLTY